MDKLLGEFTDHGCNGIRGSQIVYRLRKRNEDCRDTQLMVGKILDNISVKSENTKFVSTHYTGQELHDEDFVVERETLIVMVEDVVEFLGKCLRVMKELESGKVGGRWTFVVAFLRRMRVRKEEVSIMKSRAFLAEFNFRCSFLSPLRVFLLISRRWCMALTSGT